MNVRSTNDFRQTSLAPVCVDAARGRSLAVNIIWSIVASAFYSASQWLIIVVLARLGSARSVGQYANALATTAPIVLLAGLQLRDVQATDMRREYTCGDYLGLRLTALAAALVTIAVVALVAAPDREGVWTIGLIGLAKVFESLSDIQYGFLQQHERMDRIAQSMLVRSGGGLAAVTLGLFLTRSVTGAAAALALTWAAAALVLDRRFVRALPLGEVATAWPRFERKRLLPLLRTTAPLGVVIMLVSLQTNVPRYFIQHRLGTESLGAFAAIASLFVAGNLFVNAVNQSASPRLARAFAAEDWSRFGRALAWMLVGSLTLGLGGAVIASLFGGRILALLFGVAFAAHSKVFTLLMLVAGLAYAGSVLGYAMTAARCLNAQVPLFVAVVFSEVAASSILVPRFGLAGGALAWGLALAVQCLGAAGILAAAVRGRRHAAPLAPSLRGEMTRASP